MSTWNGIGTKFLGYSRVRPDGTHHATEWFVLNFMPVIPLRRYRLKVGATTYTPGSISGSTSATSFELFGRTRLKLLEVLATYIAWWIIGPGIAASPFLLMSCIDTDFGRGSSLWRGVVVIAGLLWVVGAPMTLIMVTNRVRKLPLI
ncbi:hypothetical protein [Streptomyces sp. NPDC051173]|uniref:hypothetical protein n=1 Tax=Streptomyces sp. NPDC051173 TaxID=3155164 RepID=UPI00344F71EA